MAICTQTDFEDHVVVGLGIVVAQGATTTIALDGELDLARHFRSP
jgi:hypothetical protein